MIIPLGFTRGGSARPFVLRMNDTQNAHTVISGETGSGKSNLLHALLLNTMLRYSDNKVEIYLIDFKHGTDFGIYGNYNLPNLKVLSLASKAPQSTSLSNFSLNSLMLLGRLKEPSSGSATMTTGVR